jgi:hypothetical protein
MAMQETVDSFDESSSVFAYRVYGDNILETELIPNWIENARNGPKLEEILQPSDRPIYVFSEPDYTGIRYVFQLCPGYGRWSKSPLHGQFSEKPDILVNHVSEEGDELETALAIEVCDAIQAGNQAWQRFRRAADAADSGIPYLYVAPLLDWEHDSGGFELKGPRYQSPQITLGQLSLSSFSGVPSLQVYEISSWCDYAEEKDYPLPNRYTEFGGLEAGQRFLVSLFRRNTGNEELYDSGYEESIQNVLTDMFEVAQRYVDFNQTFLPIYKYHPLVSDNPDNAAEIVSEALSENQPVRDSHALHNIDLSDFNEDGVLFRKGAQSRTCTDRFYSGVLSKINWKDSETKDYKIEYLRHWGIDVRKSDYTSSELDEFAKENLGRVPVSYKEAPSEACVIGSRTNFRELLEEFYPRIDSSILDWVTQPERIEDPLFFVPLYGYKPSGDSRPDRGLLPLLYAMFPKIATKENTFIIIYSVNTPDNWDELLSRGRNELWNVISKYGGAIIVDPTESGMILE